MKIFINITTWIGLSPNAIHYYGKIYKNDSKRSIYKLAEDCDIGDRAEDDLSRTIGGAEARFLNKKDGKGSLWKKGAKTVRFNSVEELKEETLKQFPNDDIAFLHNLELESADMDIVERSKEDIKETKKQLRIHNFEGFSPNFKNLIEGSIHYILNEVPERWRDHDLQPGYWVNGVNEPALVLRRECELID